MPFDRNRTDVIAQLEDAMDLARPHAAVVPAVNAGTDYEQPVYVAPVGAKGDTLARASIYAPSQINGAGTDYAVVQFRHYRAGSLVGTLTGGTTYATTATLAAQTEKKLFSGALSLEAGDVITLQSQHCGSGAALPALTAVVETSPSV